MRVLAIVHQPDAGPGAFADAIAAAGATLDTWPIAQAPAPADPVGYDAVLSFGGAMHADQEAEHPWLAEEKRLLAELLARRTPVLGVCLGAQLLSAAAGGEPRRALRPEIEWREIEVTEAGAADPLIGPLAPRFRAFEWHSYEAGLPADATVLAETEVCAQAFRLGERAWGIQFHAEVTQAGLEGWIRDYRSDPDAVHAGVDPAALARATAQHIGAGQALGRELCARFLEAARPYSPVSGVR